MKFDKDNLKRFSSKLNHSRLENSRIVDADTLRLDDDIPMRSKTVAVTRTEKEHMPKNFTKSETEPNFKAPSKMNTSILETGVNDRLQYLQKSNKSLNDKLSEAERKKTTEKSKNEMEKKEFDSEIKRLESEVKTLQNKNEKLMSHQDRNSRDQNRKLTDREKLLSEIKSRIEDLQGEVENYSIE
eukprot:CAMPEP_0116890478 /NCGR_PEP_ID=MMETSP0467-20121206/1012_1 /TAXON_ID=283647 /ORGANISM="Mesodinium pulex, Strain SPMC105" /LENGTH=184 /DNA_ID=CAMNT_0004558269 /DNA_START=7 /DNA_END=561 /DNA_ORIENTATION=-